MPPRKPGKVRCNVDGLAAVEVGTLPSGQASSSALAIVSQRDALDRGPWAERRSGYSTSLQPT